MFFLFLIFIFTLYIEKTLSQLIATVWIFGTDRLLGGQFTEPLLPLGTASDGSVTTYLWQVLNPVTTILTSNGAPVLTTSLVAGNTKWKFLQSGSRTVVVSPSGYVEPFEGECFAETGSTVFGAPTPITLVVATATPTTPTSLANSQTTTPTLLTNTQTTTPASLANTRTTTPTSLTSTQTQAPGSNTGFQSSITPSTSAATSSQITSSPAAKKMPMGAIVGIIAGVLVVSAVLFSVVLTTPKTWIQSRTPV
ncbi:hypothetical protein BDP27DRAFT_1439879 [Rhodocollybia butyracea]|uniref:Uncharacterized protein n=1 Tax=Rhodocollybia butyracea TaxID=206335 RepID=A0A9P5P4F9_9AGAR|nr:hypothetical protein BDP27DRAFT_1439879 [Rhodocollybia butyracea]